MAQDAPSADRLTRKDQTGSLLGFRTVNPAAKRKSMGPEPKGCVLYKFHALDAPRHPKSVKRLAENKILTEFASGRINPRQSLHLGSRCMCFEGRKENSHIARSLSTS